MVQDVSQDPQPTAFYETVRSGFERARASSTAIFERFYSIGGYAVRLQFAGPALVGGITPALEHLRTDEGKTPDLSVFLWDSESTGSFLPPAPWRHEDYLPRCGVRGFSDKHIQLTFEPTANILSVLSVAENQGYFWMRDARLLPTYQSGSPLLLLLHQWMSTHGRTLVHGGAVGTEQGGVLLVGKGGSGKSTATLCCLDSPLLYASDDYGLVSVSPEPYFYSLYSSGKINAPDVGKHRFIGSALRDGTLDNEKALYFLHFHFPQKISKGFPLRAIVLPRVTGNRDSALHPTSTAQAMMALAPSTLFQLPGSETETFRRLSTLVKTLPAYVLESGTDWAQIPCVIEELLSKLNTVESDRA